MCTFHMLMDVTNRRMKISMVSLWLILMLMVCQWKKTMKILMEYPVRTDTIVHTCMYMYMYICGSIAYIHVLNCTQCVYTCTCGSITYIY